MYSMDLPKFIVSIQKEEFISALRVLMSMTVQFRLLAGPVVVRYCSLNSMKLTLNIFIKQFMDRHSLGWNLLTD